MQRTLSAPPFVAVEGVFNLRDFGGYPSSLPAPSQSSAPAPARIKPGYLFRSGDPSRISPAGAAQLRALGVKKIFDLRAQVEIESYQSATPRIEGVEFVSAAILEEALDPVAIAARLQHFADNEADAFVKLYTHILDTAGGALEKILVHMRDNPDEPCLVHCTAGKDRTGNLAAVILLLLGARNQDITSDYTLTMVGLQPALPLLAKRFQALPAFRDNWKGTLSLGSAHPETMSAILDVLQTKYGGAEGYVKQHTSLTDADIARIRKNMLVPET
ncbi:protein-tyrosine phosphatase-like protein [Epithele typhae]|uniref:protein-tyrosine phosphatase-like protein n=1 Tax=Epithele typhae TaxID=378194 RepID=UPI0020078E4A|nr:protein-tyrosine phosphatase-like protein [Epithele typhae]KAH9910789.1 protein-tyrosine phosphatase-like protein [Epithele typhae]